MIHWRPLTPWLIRAWPVLELTPVVACHAIALRALPTDPAFVNKLVGMSLQVTGGLLVLYSVNDNLGLFRSQLHKSTIVGWFKDFPIIRKQIVITGSAFSSQSNSLISSVTVSLKPNTLEERVAAVESRLAEIQIKVVQEVQAVNAKIENAKSELGRQIPEASVKVTDLSKRLEHTAVGGFKLQALGLLVRYIWRSYQPVCIELTNPSRKERETGLAIKASSTEAMMAQWCRVGLH